MSTIKAADTSRFATGNAPVPQNILNDLKNTGVELFIPGAWHGAVGYDAVRQTLDNATNAGMRTATYVALTQAGKGERDVLKAYELIGETTWRALSFVALDMEWGDPLEDLDVADLDDLDAAIEKVIQLGARPCLYTAAWWWKGHFGNPDIPIGLPLWNAYYDNDPDFDFHSYPYGGQGVKLIGEQYTNSTDVGGIDVDFNTFDKEWVDAFPAFPAVNGLALLAQAWKDDLADTIKHAAQIHSGGIDPIHLNLFGYRQQDKARAWGRIIGRPIEE